MYSVTDLLAEGLPHSDIRGSTIARISPRLFAACHVLHRLLVPRHPPNALFTLHSNSNARAQGRTATHMLQVPSKPRPDHFTPRRGTARPHSLHSPFRLTMRKNHRSDTDSATPHPGARHHRHQRFGSPGAEGARQARVSRLQTPRCAAVPRRSLLYPFRGIVFRPMAEKQWRRSGSNRRPPACKAGALPAELRPRRNHLAQAVPARRALRGSAAQVAFKK